MKKILSTRNIIIFITILLTSFFVWNSYNESQKLKAPVEIKTLNDDHFIGPIDAKVVVVEYFDFQCPACRAFEPIINEVTTKYSDKVKFVFRHFPLINMHQNAMLAAISSEAAARQNKYFDMKKVLFEKQSEWGNALDAYDKIISYAESLGLDIDRFKKDLNDPSVKERVERDLKEATSLRLSGTPSVIIDGQRVDIMEIASVELFSQYLENILNKK